MESWKPPSPFIILNHQRSTYLVFFTHIFNIHWVLEAFVLIDRVDTEIQPNQ